MASCTRIDNLLQPFIDGELGDAERLIVEQHLVHCADCAALMRKHKSVSVYMFETLASQRLSRDIVASTLDHLPNMEQSAADVAGLNRRAKHPSMLRERLTRVVPIAAAIFLVFIGAILNKNWPVPEPTGGEIGLVTQHFGTVSHIEQGTMDRSKAKLKTFVHPGDRFETGSDSTMMLNILGPSEIRLAENTRVLVHDDRKLSVEKGRVFLNVGGAKRLFRVLTPMGDVTVFGTAFDVLVENSRTRVAVQEGEVQLGHIEDESVFGIVRPGQMASVTSGEHSIHAETVDIESLTQWARNIHPDEEASALFANQILSQHDTEEVAARSGYFIDTLGKPLRSLIIEWEPVTAGIQYPSYDVFVYDSENNALFRGTIDGSLFTSSTSHSHEIEYEGESSEDLRHIFVKVIPVGAEIGQEVTFRNLRARIGS